MLTLTMSQVTATTVLLCLKPRLQQTVLMVSDRQPTTLHIDVDYNNVSSHGYNSATLSQATATTVLMVSDRQPTTLHIDVDSNNISSHGYNSATLSQATATTNSADGK